MKKYLMIILGCFISAFSFNLFMVPYNILPGGVSGISIIVDHFVHIDKALFILIVSLILLVISYFALGKEITIKSVIGSILFPIFISITETILIYFPISINNIMLSIIFGGITSGFGFGLVYREGYTTGGTDIINKLLNKYLYTTMGTGVLIIEGIIVFASALVFGLNTMLYSIITIYLISMVIDRVMIGISSNKSFYIITSKSDEVTDFIINDLHHGVTKIEGKGAFTGDKKDLLLTVIPTSEYYKLKVGLKKIDPVSFFVVSDSYEVGGGE